MTLTLRSGIASIPFGVSGALDDALLGKLCWTEDSGLLLRSTSRVGMLTYFEIRV